MENRNRALVLVAAASLALAGCGAPRISFTPDGAIFGPDYAEVTFEMGVSSSFWSVGVTSQTFMIGEPGQQKLVKTFDFIEKKPKVYLFPSGAKIRVEATTQYNYGAPGLTRSGWNECKNVSLFTPQSNTRYRIVQRGSSTGPCQLSITEAGTGREPSDLEIFQFPKPSPAK